MTKWRSFIQRDRIDLRFAPLVAFAAIVLISLHGPGHQRIEVNPDAISSLRKPHAGNEDYLRKGTNCVLSMNNGTLISVVESCDEVSAALGRTEDRRTPP